MYFILTESDTVHRIAPRNVHIEKLEELIIVAAPNDKLVHNNPSYRSKPAGNSNAETYSQQFLNNNYPIQATETDGEASGYRPAIGPHSSLVPSTMRGVTYQERYPSATSLTLPPPRHSDYVTYDTRLESFNRSTWIGSEKPDKRFFADQGFFYTGNYWLIEHVNKNNVLIFVHNLFFILNGCENLIHISLNFVPSVTL